MNRPRWLRPALRPPRQRAGFARRGLIGALVVMAAAGGIGWFTLSRLVFSSEDNGILLTTVHRGHFVHDITERGEVESASNVEIASKVETKGGGGVPIIWVVDEGYVITEQDVADGKVLVELDSSALKDQETQQLIVWENSKAAVEQAENNLKTAMIAKQEYLEGKYKQELLGIGIKISQAVEDLSRLREYYDFSRKLAQRGYVSEEQLKADEAAVRKAEDELALAKKEFEVLEKFTKEKMLIQLESDIRTAEAKVEAERKSHALDEKKLREIQEQIDHCTIRADQTGQVVYANETNRWGSNDIVIEPGTLIRERQVILRLPDPAKMQVNAKINEARVALVEKGMEARIRLEASPEDELRGVVTSVSEYPAPTSWHRGDVKEYEALVKIDNPPNTMRAGLTAEVKIRVAAQDDVLQLPIQAVIEHGGKYYTIRPDGDEDVKAVEVTVGLSNDKFVVITSGLAEGDEVVQNAAKFRDDANLPKIATEPEDAEAAGPPRPERESGPPAGPSRSPGQGGPAARPGTADQGRPPAGASGAPNPAEMVNRIFERQDKDKNGKLEGDEIPAQMQSRKDAVDTNSDGAIDRAEMTAAMRQFAGRGARGPGGSGEGEPGGSGRPRGPRGGGP